MDQWPRLKNPPVIVAIVEIKFQFGPDFNISQYKKFDGELLKIYPIRNDHIKANINLPQPVAGISTAQISSVHSGYQYLTEDKTKQLTVTNENLLYVSEGSYPGWEDFKGEALNITENFKEILSKAFINRISIRFINRLLLSTEFQAEDYFNTIISAREGTIENEIDNYLVRYSMSIPGTKTKANVVQSLEEKTDTRFSFIFDIDVLNHNEISYSKEVLSEELEKIRNIKNDIFFKNVTETTIKQL